MSKTQDKRAARKAEQQAFILERRKMQLAVFESNFKVGLEIYNANKDKMSQEEIDLVEIEIEKNKELLKQLQDEINQRTEA